MLKRFAGIRGISFQLIFLIFQPLPSLGAPQVMSSPAAVSETAVPATTAAARRKARKTTNKKQSVRQVPRRSQYHALSAVNTQASLTPTPAPALAPPAPPPPPPPVPVAAITPVPPRIRHVKRKPPSLWDLWESRFNFDWLNGGYSRTPADSTYNPDNTIFQLENRAAVTDLNIDYQLIYNSRQKFVLRPRLMAAYAKIQSGDNQLTQNKYVGEFTEAFGEFWLRDLGLTLGLNNFQWGPAELISPSNPIYHFNRDQGSVLWKERGHALIRANWSPTKSLSFVLMTEPVNNADPVFIAEREFQAKVLGKAEIRSSNDAQNYFGLSGGTAEEKRPFVGAYVSYGVLKSVSAYSDVCFTKNVYNYFPKFDGTFYNMDVDDRFQSSVWSQLGTYGFRLEEEGWDVRTELLVNSRGYTREDFQNALISATNPLNPRTPSNYGRVFRSGLEFFSQRYGYLSVRPPAFGSEKQFQLSFRYLRSGMDNSAVLNAVAEWTVGDHLVFEGDVRQSFGDKDLEFTFQEKNFFFLGLKSMW